MTLSPTRYRVLSPADHPGGKTVSVYADAEGDLQARAAAAGTPLSVFVQSSDVGSLTLRVYTPSGEKGESDSGALAALAHLRGVLSDVAEVTMQAATPAQLCGGEWLLRQGDVTAQAAPQAGEALTHLLGLHAVALHTAQTGRPTLIAALNSLGALTELRPAPDAVRELGRESGTTGLVLYVPDAGLGGPAALSRLGLGRADVAFRAFGPLRGFDEDAASSNLYACLVGVLGARGLLPTDSNLLRGLQLKPGQPGRLSAQYVAQPAGQGAGGASDLWVGGPVYPLAGVPG